MTKDISLSLTLAAATRGCTTADPGLSWHDTSTGAHSSLPGAEPAHAGST